MVIKMFVKLPTYLLAMAVCVLTCVGLVGCDEDDGASFDRFTKDWHDAVNTRQTDKLFDMLDARSRRHVELQLEQLRGLDPKHHQFIINQLGGERVETLHQLTAAKYFSLWWRRVTDEKQPTMRIEAKGGEAAYMVLELDDKSQRIELVKEAGRWRWVLPKQSFSLPKVGQPAS